MKALSINAYGERPSLVQIPVPTPAAGQVLIHQQATSLNPVDPGRASGDLKHVFPLQFPFIPGGEVSGIVTALGEGVSGFQPGDEVIGFNGAGGGYAEEVLVDANRVTARPKSLSPEQAVSVLLAGRTAIQALELAGLKTDQTILIQGGAGGVGTIAIQLAHKLGAVVLTTAKEAQRDALLQLGADRVIDYSKENLGDLDRVDVVLDLIGGTVLASSYSLVKKGGVIVTANQPPDKTACEEQGIEGRMILSDCTAAGLNQVMDKVASGELVPVIDRVETLWNTDTLWSKPTSGTAVGKIVYTVSTT